MSLMFFFCLLMVGCNRSARSSYPGECQEKQEIPTCETIYNKVKSRYTYLIPQSILYVTSLKDCEYGWYQNGTCIAHSVASKTLDFVVDASPHLTTRTCERNLSWQVICENPQLKCTINYSVLQNNQAGSEPPKNGIPAWGIALIAILFFIGIVSFGIIFYSCRNCGNGSQNSMV